MVQVISSMVDIRTSCYAARLAAFSCPQKHWKALIFRGAHKQIDESLALSDGTTTMPTRVYFSYIHADVKWLKMLQKHLAPMVRDGLIVWNDEQIKPGAIWSDEIETALLKAKVAIVLLSPDYLASEFIAYTELPSLSKASEVEGLKIIWVPIEYCLYEHTDIAKYQAIYSSTRPLATLDPEELNAALVAICKTIAEAINNNDQGLAEA